jgi:hypothetical protein
MSKYCSAGKIECEVYSLDNSASGYCQASFVDRRWEQCPWPSRQRPVEKAGGDGLTVGEAVEAANFVSAIIRNAKSAGINEGVEKCEMAARGFLFDWFDSSKVAEQQLFYKGLMLVLAACKVTK